MWSHGNNPWRINCFLTLIDDFLRKILKNSMKTKFDVLDKFKVFKVLVEYHIEKNIKAIRCDGGGEYNSMNFNTFYKDYDIVK
jgi:hypothetical protein